MEEKYLTRFNEWWISGKVRNELTQIFVRSEYSIAEELLTDRRITIIYGLRRVGKTTIMYQLISGLLQKNTDPKHVLYISFDDSSADLEDVLNSYFEKILNVPVLEARDVYIFLDEIQKVKDWENKLKIYYDLYPGLKFTISESSSLNTSRRSAETLAGRFFKIRIDPLTFKDFLKLKGYNISFDKLQLSGEILKPLFFEYLKKGGFPELVNETNQWKIIEYVRSLVLDRVIAIDIPQEFGIRDVQLLRKLVDIFFYNPGMIVNLDKVSSALGRNRLTISNFISFLEYSFMIRLVSNFRPANLAISRKLKKVYPYNSAFIYALSSTGYDELFPYVLEVVAQISLSTDMYFRDGSTEVDFIKRLDGDLIPVEVKSGNIDYNSIANSFRKLNLDSGIVLNMDIFGEEKRNGVNLFLFPIWAFTLYPDEILKQFIEKHHGRKKTS